MKKFNTAHRIVANISPDDIECYERVIDLLTENLGPRFLNITTPSFSPFWDDAKRNYNIVRGEDSQWTAAMGEINASSARDWICYESTVKAYSGAVYVRELIVAVNDDTVAVQLRLMLS